MTLKPGVRLLGLRPETIVAILVADGLWRKYGAPEGVVLASAVEGRHKVGSHHYKGLAVDLRVHDIMAENRTALVTELTGGLGLDFDVIWEAKDTPNEHIHVEFDPKTPMAVAEGKA